MLELIKEIGKVARALDEELDFVSLWQKKPRPFDYTIVVDLDTEKGLVECKTIEFNPKVLRDTLFYQQANAHRGAGLAIEGEFKKEKLLKTINKCILFLEVNTINATTILEKILEITGEKPIETYFVAFYKDGKKPITLYQTKFEDLIMNDTLNKTEEIGNCHLCGEQHVLYDTSIYACYTNDKEIYSNTHGHNFGMCKQCIVDVLAGKRHSEEVLTTFWLGSQVMFLPHYYNQDIFEIYNNQTIAKGKKLLDTLQENESDILEELGKQPEWVDIIFYVSEQAYWKFEYVIKGVMPSRFTKLANLSRKYRNPYNNKSLNIYQVIKCLAISNKGQEYKRLLEAIFKGNSMSRSFVFIRLMKAYKESRLSGYTNMLAYHRIYNYLCEVGCLEKGWKLYRSEGGEVMSYDSVEQLFEENQVFFDSNEKKAWFLLGKAFGKTIYHAKNYYKAQEGSTSLEKSFFYSRKFDKKTFMVLANKCSDGLYKYGVSNDRFLKKYITEAKALYGQGAMLLGTDEAKYIFFWGMDERINYKGE